MRVDQTEFDRVVLGLAVQVMDGRVGIAVGRKNKGYLVEFDDGAVEAFGRWELRCRHTSEDGRTKSFVGGDESGSCVAHDEGHVVSYKDKRVERLTFMRRHESFGTVMHYNEGRKVRVTYEAGDARHGMTLHLDERGETARRVYSAPHWLAGLVVHVDGDWEIHDYTEASGLAEHGKIARRRGDEVIETYAPFHERHGQMRFGRVVGPVQSSRRRVEWREVRYGGQHAESGRRHVYHDGACVRVEYDAPHRRVGMVAALGPDEKTVQRVEFVSGHELHGMVVHVDGDECHTVFSEPHPRKGEEVWWSMTHEGGTLHQYGPDHPSHGARVQYERGSSGAAEATFELPHRWAGQKRRYERGQLVSIEYPPDDGPRVKRLRQGNRFTLECQDVRLPMRGGVVTLDSGAELCTMRLDLSDDAMRDASRMLSRKGFF